MTNILRDVPGDFAQGRLYIPLEDLSRHGVTEEDLASEIAAAGQGVRSPQIKALLRQQATRAREYYARAAAGLPRGTHAGLSPPRSWARSTGGILDRIEAADYDVFSRVVRIPRPQRALIAATTWARTAVGLR